MIKTMFIAWCLVALTVMVHTIGLTALMRPLSKSHVAPPTEFWPITRLLVRVTWWMIVIHLIEISVWGLFYYWQGCLPDAESAFYFAGVTYTTTGYGDLLLQPPWRMLGPVEALTGILMCGLSAGVFFAVVGRVFAPRLEVKSK